MGEKRPIKVGLIGCGAIAVRAYMPTILKQYNMVDVVKFADTVPERARMFAEKFGGVACTNEEIYNDPEIEVVLNLTYPSSHYEVTKAALEHGKHVHCEKMMAVTFEEGKELVELAEKQGLWLTLAPDTFLGGAWQTCRHIVDTGMIGEPIGTVVVTSGGGSAAMQTLGESTRRELPREDQPLPPWFTPLPGYNPRPPQGSGSPFDMGGYYLHNMINMFGNIGRVTGVCRPHAPKATSYDPLNTMYGEFVDRPEPTTMVGTLEFDSGVVGSIIMQAAGGRPEQQFIVYGSEGVMYCPDPNYFGGDVVIQSMSGRSMSFDPKVGRAAANRYTIPNIFGYNTEARGVGLMDLAFAIRNGRRPRCHYSMGFQAFECVHGMIDAYQTGISHVMISKTERPKAVKRGVFGGFGDGDFAQQSCFDD